MLQWTQKRKKFFRHLIRIVNWMPFFAFAFALSQSECTLTTRLHRTPNLKWLHCHWACKVAVAQCERMSYACVRCKHALRCINTILGENECDKLALLTFATQKKVFAFARLLLRIKRYLSSGRVNSKSHESVHPWFWINFDLETIMLSEARPKYVGWSFGIWTCLQSFH